MDASNILKPALARGELKCIGATTHQEFRKFFDKDKALSRRFAKIDVEEPSISDTFLILKGVQDKYESFHKIRFSDEALREAIDLSVDISTIDSYRIRRWILLMRLEHLIC